MPKRSELGSRWPVLLAFAIFGCTARGTPHPAGQPVAQVRQLPREVAPTPVGEGPSLGERSRGRVSVIDLWATWCEPCRVSIPKVQRLHEALGPQGLVVLGVHAGGSSAQVVDYVARAGMSYPQYLDSSLAFSVAVGSTSVPTLLVMDPEGSIVFRGHELGPEALRVIRAELAKASATSAAVAVPTGSP